MDRDLAAFASSDAPLRERLRVVRALAAALAGLHARGTVHGGLEPAAVRVGVDGDVVLAPALAGGAPARLARAGWEAPEVARGGRPTARADAFSLGALAWLALAGRAPFEAAEPLERVRRGLFEDAPPARLAAPAVPAGVDAVVQALLEKSPAKRAAPEALARAVEAAMTTASPNPAATPTATSTSNPTRTAAATATATSTSTPTATSTSTANPHPNPTAAAAAALRSAAAHLRTALRSTAPRAARAAAARLVRLRALTPVQRAGLAAAPLVLAAALLLPESEAALSRDVAALLARGDVAEARRRVDEAARARPGDPLVEKLRGDVACARGAPGECLRRYRVALAARPGLREDAALRANARRLVARGEACGTRRGAAQLLGELRDPEALPALEAARRSGGFFAFLCTGDSIDRAIQATRADLPR